MDRYIRTSDGIELRYKTDLIDDPKAIVLINHGFAEHLDRYDFISGRLNDGGYSVYRYDLRGHGRTRSKKGDIESFEEFAEDAQTMVNLIKEENKGKEVYMLGHSMGGFVSCLYALNYPDELAGQILSGPAVDRLPKAQGINGVFLKYMSPLLGGLDFPNIIADDICSVDQVVEDFKNDPLVLKKTTIRFLDQFLLKGTDYILGRIENYNYPCLICHGGDDIIVPVDISRSFYDEIGSEDKTIKVYDGLYHEILNEREKYEVARDMVDWLDERVIRA